MVLQSMNEIDDRWQTALGQLREAAEGNEKAEKTKADIDRKLRWYRRFEKDLERIMSLRPKKAAKRRGGKRS